MKRPSRYCVGTSHDFLQNQVGGGGGVEVIRKKIHRVTVSTQINSIHVSFLPSTEPAEVESVHQRRPEELETKWPEDKAEEGLVFVADTLTL